MQFRANESTVRRSLARLALFAAASIGASGAALAADYKIPASTRVFYCSAAKPGDTLTLAAGTRGPLFIRDCKGTASSHIVVRNDSNGSAPTTLQRSSGHGGFLLSCDNCVGVSIDGSQKWRGAPAGKTYGIRMTVTGRTSPTAFLAIRGTSRFVTIRNVEIDGKWPALTTQGSGIRVNDNAVKRNANPGLWREGFLIEDNYIHDIAREGMYVGPNYASGDIPLRNIEIRNNLVEDTGNEGINTKSMWEGDNKVHHNRVLRAGNRTSSTGADSQFTGIKNMSGTVKIYNNWVEATGQHGIQVWTQTGPRESEGKGPFEAQIWNNVIVDAGKYWRPFMNASYGINVGAQAGREQPRPTIYNNTIINSRQSGINVGRGAGPGIVRDNIVAGAKSNPAIEVIGGVGLVNNRIGSVADMEFVDPARLNFRLKIGSPARNEGTNDFPPIDHADVRRPLEGAGDQGAYEGSGS